MDVCRSGGCPHGKTIPFSTALEALPSSETKDQKLQLCETGIDLNSLVIKGKSDSNVDNNDVTGSIDHTVTTATKSQPKLCKLKKNYSKNCQSKL